MAEKCHIAGAIPYKLANCVELIPTVAKIEIDYGYILAVFYGFKTLSSNRFTIANTIMNSLVDTNG